MDHSRTVSEILSYAARQKAREIGEQIVALTGNKVVRGPFAGMELPKKSSWGDGDIGPKLLGTYEEDLHVSIETCISRQPTMVVNVGCAEGYYAIGLALRLPEAIVHAVDTAPMAIEVCAEAALANNVLHQVNFFDLCSLESFPNLLSFKRSLIVMDVEGAELDLICPDTVDYLTFTDLIIECHEKPGQDKSTVKTMLDLLMPTHETHVIREGPRDPSGYTCLQSLSTIERYAAVCEFRPCSMNWVVAIAKA